MFRFVLVLPLCCLFVCPFDLDVSQYTVWYIFSCPERLFLTRELVEIMGLYINLLLPEKSKRVNFFFLVLRKNEYLDYFKSKRWILFFAKKVKMRISDFSYIDCRSSKQVVFFSVRPPSCSVKFVELSVIQI